MRRLFALVPCGDPSKKLTNLCSILRPSCTNLAPRCYSTEKDGGKLGGMGEKARSTAEEFLRVAEAKAGEAGESARETLEEAKEAALGESERDKERYKERVEEGKSYQNADRE